MQHISIYRGRQWSTSVCTAYTSSYITKDYKPSDIHRWVSAMDAYLDNWWQWLSHTLMRECQEPLVSLQSHRLPWKLLVTQILTLAWVGRELPPCLIPLILQQTHFPVLCMLYFLIDEMVPLKRRRKLSPILPFQILCAVKLLWYNCHAEALVLFLAAVQTQAIPS